MNKMNLDQILDRGMEFASKEYSNRQQKCFDGDPTGFAIIFNSKSNKFSCLALGSKKLDDLSKNAMHIYNVYSNGSCERTN